MVQNPQWPVIDEAISFPSGPNTPPSIPTDMWASVIGRTEGSTTTNRGRLYELDQVQTGESTVVLRNTDGAFDPDNTASPFYPAVLPYRAHRRRAQYPPTANLLLPSQATAGLAPDTPGGSALSLGTLPPSVYGNATGVPTTVADTGTYNDYQIAYPASPGAHGRMMSIGAFSITPGQAHTAQCQARFTAGVAIQMQLAVQWIGVDGHTAVGTTSGAAVTLTGANQLVTVTGTAPANAVGAYLILWNTNSPASASTVGASQFQIELGATPSAYAQPGIWYPLITDFVLEWPQTWQDNGNYGVSPLRNVDAFGYLSQRNLKSPAYMELLALGPSFFYPLDEAQDADLFYDMTANRAPMPIAVLGGAPATNLSCGNTLQSTAPASAAGFLPKGVGGPVVTMTNPDLSTIYGPIAVLNLGVTGQVGPSPTSAWTRIFAVRVPVVPTPSVAYVWAVISNRTTSGILLGLTGNVGQPFIDIVKNGADAIGGGGHLFGNTVADGGWHMLAVTMSADGKTIHCFMDNLGPDTVTSASDMRPTLTGGNEMLGGCIDSTDSLGGYAGDMAFVAELPYAMTAAQQSLLFSTFKFGGSGYGVTSSGDRYQDILRWAGWVGAQAEDNWTTGETQLYGPAVDLIAAAGDQGTDVVTAGQNVVTTENGNHYVAKDGTVTFKARRARYNQTTPVATFGENTAGGEIPYTSVSFGYDVTRLANDAAISQPAAGLATRVYDAPSITTYGDIQMQRDVNTLDPNEAFDAATFLVDRYRKPMQRLQTISIDLGANPAAWDELLGLELGSLVKVMRRPPNAAALTFLGFVEKISWTMTDQVDATCSMEISNGTGMQYEVAGSTRMTLKTAVLAAATSMTCNPLADAATNSTQSNISGSDGSATWVIDWGTVNAEYVQINSVTPNAPGYTSAVFGIGLCTDVATLASGTGFRHAHAIGATLQDIGGGANVYTFAQLAQILAPANQLDGFATLGVSTILGY